MPVDEQIIPHVTIPSTEGPWPAAKLSSLIERLNTKNVKEIHIDLSNIHSIDSNKVSILEEICFKFPKVKLIGFAQLDSFFQTIGAKFYPHKCKQLHIEEETTKTEKTY